MSLFSLGRMKRRLQFYRKLSYGANDAVLMASRNVEFHVHSNSSVQVRNGIVRLGDTLPGSAGFASYSHSVLEVCENAELIFEGDAWIGPGFSIKIKEGGKLVIGKEVTIAHNCLIYCTHEMKFGNHVGVSWNCHFIDDDGHPYFTPQGEKIQRSSRPLILEDHSTVHMGVMIPRGVTLGRNCIVGAGTIVRQNIPPQTLVYGASPLKTRSSHVFDVQEALA